MRLQQALDPTSVLAPQNMKPEPTAHPARLSDLTERIRELERERDRLRSALEAGQAGFYEWDLVEDHLVWSRRHEELWGFGPGDFGGTYSEFSARVHPEDLAMVEEEVDRCLAGQSLFRHEYRVVWPDGSVHWIASSGEFSFDSDRNPLRMRGTVMEITERKRTEQLLSLSGQLMTILNDTQAMRRRAELILSAIKRETGLSAVGIRLRQGDDFPYHGAEGFSLGFLLSEDSLTAYDRQGEVCRDRNGEVLLECTCGLVLSGRTDPGNPLFTEGGSAWTNDARTLLHVPADQDPRLNPRNRCIHDGYQSVALIPIRVGNEIMGLFQLNDRRKDCFTAGMIRFFEGMASSFGMALLRQRENQAQQERETTLRSLLDAMPQSVLLMDPDGILLAANATLASRLGIPLKDCIGRSIHAALPSEMAEECEEWIAELLRTRAPAVYETKRNGQRVRHSVNPVQGANGVISQIAVVSTILSEPGDSQQLIKEPHVSV